MPTDLTIELEDRPGELARLGETMGAAGINIEGFCASRVGDRGQVHVLVEDEAAARDALEKAGIIVVGGRETVVIPIESRPGELGRASRTLADAGANIELAYVGEKGLVFAVDDVEKARSAL